MVLALKNPATNPIPARILNGFSTEESCHKPNTGANAHESNNNICYSGVKNQNVPSKRLERVKHDGSGTA